MTEPTEPVGVLGMGPAELTALVARWGGKPFRARQLMRWVHQ
ncbi:MAG: 23S rRNA (adenine(2503)-C(2))-methyltransferase RlmN, partial [Pusillimonas sp.]|nr:23S rRNA (adenine(2503)-C(2))-methyltransferase RlmN [Pusillimonas sp.]